MHACSTCGACPPSSTPSSRTRGFPASADYAGQPVQRIVNGFADSRFRLSVNLYGAPALTLAEFAGYKQDVIVGASLQVGVPWGQYDDTRVVNIGHESMAVQAGDRRFQGGRTVDARVDGGRDVLHRQHRLLRRKARARRTRSIRSRLMRSTTSAPASGRRSTPPTSPAGVRRSTACAAATSSRTGGWAQRSRCPSTSTTRSSSMRAAACRRAPTTTSICSASPGSTAGAAASDERVRRRPALGAVRRRHATYGITVSAAMTK